MDQLLATTTETIEEDTVDWTADEVPPLDEEAVDPPELNAESLDYLNQPATPEAMQSAEIAEDHREGIPVFIRTGVPPQDSDDLAKMTEVISGGMSPVIVVGKHGGLGKNALCGNPVAQCSAPSSTYRNFKITTAAGGGDDDEGEGEDDNEEEEEEDDDEELVIDTTFEDYVFGTPCGPADCDADCFDCRQSWPRGDQDKWKSED